MEIVIKPILEERKEKEFSNNKILEQLANNISNKNRELDLEKYMPLSQFLQVYYEIDNYLKNNFDLETYFNQYGYKVINQKIEYVQGKYMFAVECNYNETSLLFPFSVYLNPKSENGLTIDYMPDKADDELKLAATLFVQDNYQKLINAINVGKEYYGNQGTIIRTSDNNLDICFAKECVDLYSSLTVDQVMEFSSANNVLVKGNNKLDNFDQYGITMKYLIPMFMEDFGLNKNDIPYISNNAEQIVAISSQNESKVR